MSEPHRSIDRAPYRHLRVAGPMGRDAHRADLATAGWPGRLSRREADVLRLLAEGQSTVEIGTTLFITPATVKCHVARLIAKVGVRDRVQLVIAAYRSGFVSVD